MEFDLAKLILASMSAIGTMAVVFYNVGQTRKIKSELLREFEEAISRGNKHSVTELFRLIHGLRMSYTDIRELINHDNCVGATITCNKTTIK